MDLADVLANYGPLDALERNIENAPIPEDTVFQDPSGQMLDKLERDIEASEVKPPLVPEEPTVPENPSQSYLPSQEESQQARFDQKAADSPPLPYYIEAPEQLTRFHKQPPRSVRGRIGRCGGRGFRNSHTGPGDKIYCPIEKSYVVFPDFCEEQGCQYYDEDSDSEDGRHCTYYDEEEKA